MNPLAVSTAALLGSVLLVSSPAMADCSRLSTFLTPPPSQDIYPALLHEVDGRLAGSLDSEVVRVEPGRRLLKVGPQIDIVRPAGPRRPLAGHTPRGRRFSELDLDVEAGQRYHLGVRWVAGQSEEEGGGWEAVVWKKSPEACR